MSIDRGDTETIRQAVDRDRLVSTASDLVAIKSPTGHEEEAASYLAGVFHDLGLETTLQPVEEGRANAVGRHAGTGEGPSLMFNGHLDTSYSGDEAWLHGRGFKPSPLVEGDAIWGLGIMNMKGAIACYVEAVRALLDSGVTLEGDVVIAAVAGEIEKTQWGDEYRGKDFRGYGTGTRHLVTHGVLTDACVLGEPTEERIVLGHFGTMWARISTKGPFFHTAFSAGRLEENSIMRMQEVIGALRPWIADWEQTATYQGRSGIVNLGSVRGGFPWRASRTPGQTDLFLDVRVPPTMPMLEATRAFRELTGDLQLKFPDFGIDAEVFVTSPGAEISPDHSLVTALDLSHADVHGGPPDRDYVHWASDASTLVRYGIDSVNYGPISSALPGPEGEQVPISSLINVAQCYALTAARFCGVNR